LTSGSPKSHKHGIRLNVLGELQIFWWLVYCFHFISQWPVVLLVCNHVTFRPNGGHLNNLYMFFLIIWVVAAR
jgi:hypothetical protein